MNFSDSQFHKIFADAMAILQDARITKIDWKKKGKLILGMTVAFLISTAACLIYFFVTHHIGPLMVDVACTIPILCFAVMQQSRQIQNLQTEFTEYRTAVGDMTDYLQINLEGGLLSQELRVLIDIAQKEGDDVIKAFVGIQDESDGLVEELAGNVAQSVIETAQANIIQRTQEMKVPGAPEEDLSVRV